MTKYVVGNVYTHRETIDCFGGGKTQVYLPTKNRYRQSLGARIKMELNPDAPNIVVVGDTKDIMKSAKNFAVCGYAVPLFIKMGNNMWRYEGRFRCVKQSSARTDLAKYISIRPDATSLLFLEKVP